MNFDRQCSKTYWGLMVLLLAFMLFLFNLMKQVYAGSLMKSGVTNPHAGL